MPDIPGSGTAQDGANTRTPHEHTGSCHHARNFRSATQQSGKTQLKDVCAACPPMSGSSGRRADTTCASSQDSSGHGCSPPHRLPLRPARITPALPHISHIFHNRLRAIAVGVRAVTSPSRPNTCKDVPNHNSPPKTVQVSGEATPVPAKVAQHRVPGRTFRKV
jgi:hypothetical protein